MASDRTLSTLDPEQARRAMRLTYVQVMFAAVYAASTGGMFLIGYALQLGADNVQIGLMSTIPMFCVVVQIAAAMMVERGVSRRRLTFVASLGNVLGWALVIVIPYMGASASATTRIGLLIAILTLVTAFAHVAGNARGSWIGDLVPSEARGRFFGWINTFAGLIGAVFAIVEGASLDRLRQHGLGAFSLLFGFGMIFGLVSAWLFLPQADVPIRKPDQPTSLRRHAADALRNRALMAVLLFAVLWSMQSIAGPFYVTYMLRDMNLSFFQVGCVNAVATVSLLAGSPFWGRVVDRYGCRPTLVAGVVMSTPVPLVWCWLGPEHAKRALWLVPTVNVYAGFAVGAVSVALSTMIYKVTPTVGRSVQLAVYSIIVVVLVAPLPTLGGYLPGLLEQVGVGGDLRFTFYLSSLAMAASAVAAARIPEPGCGQVGVLFRRLPEHLLRPASLAA